MNKVFEFLSNEGLNNFTNPILIFLSNIKHFAKVAKHNSNIVIHIDDDYSFNIDNDIINKLLVFLKDCNYKLIDFTESDIGDETQTYSIISLNDKLYRISYYLNSYGNYCYIGYKEVKIKSIESIIEYQ